MSDVRCIPEASKRLSGAPEQRVPPHQDPKESYDDITCGPGPLEARPEVDLSDDVVIVNEDVTKTGGTTGQPVNSDLENSQLNLSEDEDFELQAMFYLPKWRSPYPPPYAELHPGRDESLKVILANVEALLSRSPPSLIEDFEADVAASPQRPPHPFQVSFTLNIDDCDDEEMVSVLDNEPAMSDLDKSSVGQENRDLHQSHARVQQSASRGKTPAGGPTWDAIFDDDDEDDCVSVKQADQIEDSKEIRSSCLNEEGASCWDDVKDEEMQEWTDGVEDASQMDNSIDLFGDDEAFLQMTIPDVPTPGVSPRTSPAAHAAQTPCTSTDPHREDATTNPTANGPHGIAKAEHNTGTAIASDPLVDQISFDKSRDLFSVNFDLGYSMEDSDEDREDPGPSAPTSALPLKQADSSTPNSYFHNKPPQSRQPKLSTPQMPSEHRRREASSFSASPLTRKGDAFPSPITSTGARRTLLPAVSPGTPSVLSSLKWKQLGDHVTRESVRAAPQSPHLGGFFPSRNLIPDFECLRSPAPDACVSSLSQWSVTVTARTTSWFVNEDSPIRLTPSHPKW